MRSTGLLLALAWSISTTACGPTCGDEVVGGNENCAPGCDGVDITFVGCDVEAGQWCHDGTFSREIVTCLIDERTGVAFFLSGDPDRLPAGFRRCSTEESIPECS